MPLGNQRARMSKEGQFATSEFPIHVREKDFHSERCSRADESSWANILMRITSLTTIVIALTICVRGVNPDGLILRKSADSHLVPIRPHEKTRIPYRSRTTEAFKCAPAFGNNNDNP